MTEIVAAGVPTPMYISKCAFNPGFPESRRNCRKPGVAVEILLFISNVLRIDVRFLRHSMYQEDQFLLLENHVADMFIDAKTLKQSRIVRAAYSTVPIDEKLTYHIVIRAPTPDVVLMHTRPLSEAFWFCVIGTVVSIAAVWLILSLCQIDKSHLVDQLKVARYRLAKPYGHKAQSCLYILLGVSLGIFLSFYSSVLTIALSQQGSLPLPFKDLSDLAKALQTGDYRLISANNTLIHREIVCPIDTPLDPVLVEMKKACQRNPPVLESDEVKMINEVAVNPKMVAIVGSQKLRALRIKNPQITSIPTRLPAQFAVFYYSRNSSFRVPEWLIERVSEKYENLLNLYVEDFEDRQLEQQTTNTTANKKQESPFLGPLNAAQMRGAFVTLVGGLSLGVVALMAETHFWRRQKSSDLQEALVSFFSLALVGPKSP